jgi:hypothetical protein
MFIEVPSVKAGDNISVLGRGLILARTGKGSGLTTQRAGVRVYDNATALGSASVVAQVVRLLNGDWPWGFTSEWMRQLTPTRRKRLHMAFTDSLRRLVNQWIDSGKDPERRKETPRRRNVCGLPTGYTTPLSDALLTWYRRNAPEIDILPSGQTSIIMHCPTGEPSGRYAQESAVYWLKELLNSPPDCYRLARCDNPKCQAAYYLRKRVREVEVTQGTYCRSCSGVGSIARMKASRDQRKQHLVNLAADVWEGFRPTANHPKRSDWVAAQMNKDLELDKRKQGKWVTQNQRAIEVELERRKHAKG